MIVVDFNNEKRLVGFTYGTFKKFLQLTHFKNVIGFMTIMGLSEEVDEDGNVKQTGKMILGFPEDQESLVYNAFKSGAEIQQLEPPTSEEVENWASQNQVEFSKIVIKVCESLDLGLVDLRDVLTFCADGMEGSPPKSPKGKEAEEKKKIEKLSLLKQDKKTS